MNNGKPNGHSLVEVLVTLLVIAVGIIGSVRLQADNIGLSGSSRAYAQAQLLARSHLDQLRDFMDTDEYQLLLSDGAATVISNQVSYQLTWSIQPSTDTSARFVDLRVDWEDRAGAQQLHSGAWIAPRPPLHGGKILFEALPP